MITKTQDKELEVNFLLDLSDVYSEWEIYGNGEPDEETIDMFIKGNIAWEYNRQYGTELNWEDIQDWRETSNDGWSSTFSFKVKNALYRSINQTPRYNTHRDRRFL